MMPIEKSLSRYFGGCLKQVRDNFTCPPENIKDHVMAAAKAFSKKDHQNAFDISKEDHVMSRFFL
jgi:hypothetical protein